MLVVGGIFCILAGLFGVISRRRFQTHPQEARWSKKIPFSHLVEGREEYYLRVGVLVIIFFIVVGTVMLVLSVVRSAT